MKTEGAAQYSKYEEPRDRRSFSDTLQSRVQELHEAHITTSYTNIGNLER